MKYTNTEKEILLKTAKDAIYYGLTRNNFLPINANDYSANLQVERATFVTLTIDRDLRGCIGSLVAYQPLIKDVACNAYAAAFSDPRFSALSLKEFPKLEIHISVLSEPQAMLFNSESDLIRQLRPGIDGLILEDHIFCGTFLPAVWEELPTPEMFLQHLKLKAGLPIDYWSDTLTVKRYTTISIQ